jgi:putative endonuclease
MKALLQIADRLRHNARLRTGNTAHAWGKRGEDLAHRYLQALGYIVVARNYRNSGGSAEVDLIARDGETVVFVEVKTRATDRFGSPAEAVDAGKRRKIVRGAADYIHRTGGDWKRARFDIISVLFAENERLQHIRDAFVPDSKL